jgi:hypothetical protein
VGTLARLAAGRSSSSVAAAAGAAASTSDAQGLAFEDFKTAAEKVGMFDMQRALLSALELNPVT